MVKKVKVIEYSEEDIAEMRDAGIDEDAIPSVGKHKFKKVSKEKVFPRKESKMRINTYLDCDIVDHFRSRASQPNAAPYQTQINAELRKVMERDLAQERSEINDVAEKLLADEDFVAALAEKLKR